MENAIKNIRSIAGLILLALFAWFFTDLFIYICVAIVVSIIGRPLVRLLSARKIRKFKIGSTIAAIITIGIMLTLIAFFILFIGPLIAEQAQLISAIDPHTIGLYYKDFLQELHQYLEQFGFLNHNDRLLVVIQEKLKNLVSFSYISTAFGSVISTTGSIFMAFSIVLFLSFFFLSEPELVRNFILWITPRNHQNAAREILIDSRKLLSRYFIGLLIELVSMMILISSALAIFGVHNAILIGFLGGLMNIIPYIGPLIGIVIGSLLGIIYVLALGMYDQLFYSTSVIIGSFLFANMIDNFILQPVIYSKSVKAHPLEIFLVIIMAGNIAGITGMIAAVPVYTIIKVIYNQYAQKVETGEI
ncbi:MAG TPA: AI-2E family transporter [Bacteroidales bacterium]|nr:AI-2E family transporter [Bacteroidales bacterium]